MISRFTSSKRRSNKASTSNSEASIVWRLTLDLEMPTVSAISGITSRYWRVETPRIRMSRIRRAQSRLVLHGLVGRNFDLLAWAWPFLSQARPLDRQLAVAQHHRSRLPAVPDHLAFALSPLLAWPSGGLLRGQLQHGLNRGSSGPLDQLVAGHSALLDQIPPWATVCCPFRVRNSPSFRALTFPCLSIM